MEISILFFFFEPFPKAIFTIYILYCSFYQWLMLKVNVISDEKYPLNLNSSFSVCSWHGSLQSTPGPPYSLRSPSATAHLLVDWPAPGPRYQSVDRRARGMCYIENLIIGMRKYNKWLKNIWSQSSANSKYEIRYTQSQWKYIYWTV